MSGILVSMRSGNGKQVALENFLFLFLRRRVLI